MTKHRAIERPHDQSQEGKVEIVLTGHKSQQYFHCNPTMLYSKQNKTKEGKQRNDFPTTPMIRLGDYLQILILERNSEIST